MRELHVVAMSEDGRHLLLATSRDAVRGGFRIAVDKRLKAALNGDLGAPGDPAHRESALSPREIQARLRAGASTEDVARAAGVTVARIERFSGPVLSERDRMVEQVRAGLFTRPRRGVSAVRLGEAVDAHLAETSGLRPESVSWTAYRRDNGSWVVRVSYLARARAREASWALDPVTHEVRALDQLASTLAYREPRVRGAAAPAAPSALPRARKTATTRKAASKGASKAGAGKTGATTARAGNAAGKAGRRKAAGTTGGLGRAPARRPRMEPPAVAPDPAPQANGTTQGASKGRASVPGWADILLGAAPAPPPAGNGRRRSRRAR